MKRTIKSPAMDSRARIQSRVRESIRYDYTPLPSLCNIKPTIFYIDGIHRDLIFYKNLTSVWHYLHLKSQKDWLFLFGKVLKGV